MKKLLFTLITGMLLFTVGCRQEKAIIKTPNVIFKENTSGLQSIQPSMVTDNSNSHEAKAQMLHEMMENKLPMSSPQLIYPTWQSYNEMYQSKVKDLSPLTQQYCSQLFLSSYNIPEQTESKELIAVVKSFVGYLINQKYQGYKLLYQTMEWLKNSNEKDFVNVEKEKVQEYATPALQVPNPKLQDSKLVLQNEKLKKELDNMMAKMKENDNYIEKIKTL